MIKKILPLFIMFILFFEKSFSDNSDIYKKIDLFSDVLEKLRANGVKNSKIEGKESLDWKLIDGIDLIVHIFNPDKRNFYELEKMWSELIPKEKVMI